MHEIGGKLSVPLFYSTLVRMLLTNEATPKEKEELIRQYNEENGFRDAGKNLLRKSK